MFYLTLQRKFKNKNQNLQIKSAKIHIMVISDYYENLSEKGKVNFRNEVVKRLGIGLATFYYKLRKGSWRCGEIEIIENIVKNNEYA